MSPTPEVLYPKLNSALSLLISLRYFQLNITMKPFYEGSKLIMRILGDPMIILISGSLPIENHCQLHQWEENKTWVSKRRCSYLLENHPIQSNSIHFVDWRGKIYQCWITAWNLVTSTHFTMQSTSNNPDSVMDGTCDHIFEP